LDFLIGLEKFLLGSCAHPHPPSRSRTLPDSLRPRHEDGLTIRPLHGNQWFRSLSCGKFTPERFTLRGKLSPQIGSPAVCFLSTDTTLRFRSLDLIQLGSVLLLDLPLALIHLLPFLLCQEPLLVCPRIVLVEIVHLHLDEGRVLQVRAREGVHDGLPAVSRDGRRGRHGVALIVVRRERRDPRSALRHGLVLAHGLLAPHVCLTGDVPRITVSGVDVAPSHPALDHLGNRLQGAHNALETALGLLCLKGLHGLL